MSDHNLEKRHNLPHPHPTPNKPMALSLCLSLSGRKHMILKSQRPGFKISVQLTTYCLCTSP